ncbi:MAG TPA: hypothetical protein VEO54_20760 [Thermoanaerobaculia bacterium]|nr:hypothetical protein [Thermoanaerobaculia bacterium]
MKKIAMFALFLIAVVTLSFAQQQVPVQQQMPPGYNFVPYIPPEAIDIAGATTRTPMAEDHAWALFVALNWPAPQNGKYNGVPDRNNVIGGRTAGGEDVPAAPAGPTVWQTYMDTNDLFLPGAAKPASFDAKQSIPAPCKSVARDGHRVLRMTEKVSDVLQSIHEANPNVRLIAQNGKEVWYEVRVNRAYYDYVVNNGLYNSNNRKGKKISFPAGSSTGRGEGAIRVKAAWMEITDRAQARYLYTSEALLYSPKTSRCRAATMGLVGLHIVHKTETFPSWVWATFEHVYNAPDVADVQSGQVTVPPPGFWFYDPKCKDCLWNQPPLNNDPHPRPTQVVRYPPVVSSGSTNREALNTSFSAALRQLGSANVWQYYGLVDAQWGLASGTPEDVLCLTNATMETYIQCGSSPIERPGQQATNVQGCMACHSQAKKTDFDFQLLKASPAMTLGDVRRAIDALDGQPQ